MRLGGWWRLWICLSGLWIVGALVVAFFIAERPTASKVADDLGRWCDLDLPVPPQFADLVLEMPAHIAKLDTLQGDVNAAARKPIVQAMKSTVEGLAAHAGKAADFDVNVVYDPDGKNYIVLAPAHFTDAQVFEQAEKDKYSLNSWGNLGGSCAERLRAQARNDVYPTRLKEWVLGTLAGVISFPLISLLLGAFIGWVWRGFRANRDGTQ